MTRSMQSFSPSNPPSAVLPPLTRISSCPPHQILDVLLNIQALYWPKNPSLPISALLPKLAAVSVSQPSWLRAPKNVGPLNRVLSTATPDIDSGYASADEDASPRMLKVREDLDTLRADSFERNFATRWLTGLISRSSSLPCEDDDIETIIEAASNLLAAFAGTDEESEECALTRTFSFPTTTSPITVQLNDAALLSGDHTSVGLQSWASAIVIAEKMCIEPGRFGLADLRPLRVLELGAGTGLLSIVAAKLLPPSAATTIIATDYHTDVLDNLRVNVCTNFPHSSSIDVLPLDWEHPTDISNVRFDVILAADVIYHPDHARWIRNCVEKFLARPNHELGLAGGTFWLIVPLRTTGRYEGIHKTVDTVFGETDCPLEVLERMEMGRIGGGQGRADESGYVTWKFSWAKD